MPSTDEALERYRSIRDFGATPEPAGARGDTRSGSSARFVIQQHDATRLHWDLRLERDGVLVSWALPRGVPWSPAENHLAVHTEDHPMEYLDFAGEIPEGSYGAGTMTVWDRGVYEAEEFTDTKVRVVLHGERVSGRYALFPVNDRDWMIHRMDPPADPGRRPIPNGLRPMLAVPGELPDDDEAWGYEIRWSGERVLAASSGGRVTVHDADGTDLIDRLPELRRLGRSLGITEVLLDGVVVAVGSGGRPSEERGAVARRVAATSASTARRLLTSAPVALMIVDLLWLDGHPLVDRTYVERRRELETLSLEGPAWQTPSVRRGGGAALLTAAEAQGLGGLVAKRLDSPYRPGERSPEWREIAARYRPAG
jgi:bifunctional non-homologous end joining protein LigD